MKYLFVFIGLSLFFHLHAQETVNETKETVSPAPPEEIIPNEGSPVTDKKIAETVDQESKAEEAETENAVVETSPNFDVFNPSEDISEDLAVPFPVDI